MRFARGALARIKWLKSHPNLHCDHRRGDIRRRVDRGRDHRDCDDADRLRRLHSCAGDCRRGDDLPGVARWCELRWEPERRERRQTATSTSRRNHHRTSELPKKQRTREPIAEPQKRALAGYRVREVRHRSWTESARSCSPDERRGTSRESSTDRTALRCGVRCGEVLLRDEEIPHGEETLRGAGDHCVRERDGNLRFPKFGRAWISVAREGGC